MHPCGGNNLQHHLWISHGTISVLECAGKEVTLERTVAIGTTNAIKGTPSSLPMVFLLVSPGSLRMRRSTSGCVAFQAESSSQYVDLGKAPLWIQSIGLNVQRLIVQYRRLVSFLVVVG